MANPIRPPRRGQELDALVTGGATGGLLLTDNVRAWVLAVPTANADLYNAATAVLA